MNHLCKLGNKLAMKILRFPLAFRNYTTENFLSEVKLEKLNGRSIISVSGQDAVDFLQSLITNDLQSLLKDKQSIYTTFLNVRGRVIHDAIIYRSPNGNSFLIEADTFSNDALLRHLSIHVKHRGVSIQNLEQKFSVWVLYNPNKALPATNTGRIINPINQEANDLAFLEEIYFGDEAIISHDPRILSLGARIVAPKEIDVGHLIRKGGFCLDKARPGEFKLMRYKVGVCEGLHETLYGKHYPQELNCDFLNILCNKKEFLGQAAMKKYTSPENVESRLVPLKLRCEKMVNFPSNTPLMDLRQRKRSPLGYLRGIKGIFGIALVRMSNREDKKEVRIEKHLALCLKPFWWPDVNQTVKNKQLCNA